MDKLIIIIYVIKQIHCLQATIVRNAKDTAHTKAERNILEGVKVLMPYFLFNCSVK